MKEGDSGVHGGEEGGGGEAREGEDEGDDVAVEATIKGLLRHGEELVWREEEVDDEEGEEEEVADEGEGEEEEVSVRTLSSVGVWESGEGECGERDGEVSGDGERERDKGVREAGGERERGTRTRPASDTATDVCT